jgi:hypothetical protein
MGAGEIMAARRSRRPTEEAAMKVATSLTLAALLGLPTVTAAQEPQPVPASPEGAPEKDRAWNLSIGTGAGGFVEWADAFAGSVAASYDSTRRSHRLQLNVRADREQGRWFRYGLAYAYNSWTYTYLSNGTSIGSIDNTDQNVMVDVTARWFRSDHFEFYSALAAGLGRWSAKGTIAGGRRDEVTTHYAFQLRYAGISVGNERIRGFVDLGVGMEGLIVGGLTLRL